MRRQQNKDFVYNRKRLFSDILGKGKDTDKPPDRTDCEIFWRSIWGERMTDEGTDWITRKVADNITIKEEQVNCVITLEDLKEQLRKTPNWKSPGVDGIHPFWIKNLTCFHTRIVDLLNECLY